MMNRIWISYSASETVEYCCLKYFFQACGIWAVDYREMKELGEAEAHLCILGVDDAQYIQPYTDGRFYLVKRNSTFRSFLNRRDVVEFKWKNASGNLAALMERLFWKSAECKIMQELIGVYMQEKLWGVSWLFHEIAYEDNPSWDKYIGEICAKTKEQLDKSDLSTNSWNHRFMKTYCNYMICGVSTKSTISRSAQCSDLLQQCGSLAEERGWVPSLCILTARICGMSKLKEKYALNYYRSARKYGDSSENLYDIGHIYEKLYGKYAEAMEYYIRSWRLSNSNYRPLYKIAVDMEEKGDWMSALRLYENIRKCIRENKEENSISIKAIEYEYKVLRRIIWLVKTYMDDEKLLNHLQEELEMLRNNLETRTDFRKLVHCMFGREHAKQKETEILAELQKKVLRTCKN